MKSRRTFFLSLILISGGGAGQAAEVGFLRAPGAAASAAALLESLPDDSSLKFELPPRITDNEIVFTLQALERGMPRSMGELRLIDRNVAPPQMRQVTKSFAMAVENPRRDERVLDRLITAAHVILLNDDGAFGRYSAAPDQISAHGQLYPLGLMTALLAAALGGIIFFSGKRPIDFAIKRPHALQVLTQGLIYIYWAVYWPGVIGHLQALLAQLVFAFFLDGCVSLITRRRWDIGLSFIPVVLSINLFAWFGDPFTALAVISVAILSKALIRRGQSHIFNPSAFALSVAGGLALVRPALAYEGLFHKMNIPPNMLEVMLLLSLIPQLRFSIVLVSIGAFTSMGVPFSSVAQSVALHPPVILALTLLATDPATIPRTGGGKLGFGLFIGIGIILMTMFGAKLGIPNEYAKIIPIPFANALVPLFDRLESRFVFARRWLEPTANHMHVALWLTLATLVLSRNKARHFNGDVQWTYKTPQIATGSDGVPRCVDNPVFCRPFSFLAETRLWAAPSATRQ